MAEVFDFADYQSFLRASIDEHRGSRGFQAKIAKAAECQASYFSQTLKGAVELTPDHAAGICRFFEFSDDATQYFMTLVHLSRAATPRLRNLLLRDLRRIKTTRSQLIPRLRKSGAKPPSSQIVAEYFSSWAWAAVHMAVSTEAYSTPAAVAKRLGLRLPQVQEILERLCELGLARCKDQKWQHMGGSLHLEEDSLINETNHANWRHRALLDLQHPSEQSLHYTSVFALTQADAENLRRILIDAIQKSRDLIEPSAPEELYCLDLDLFRV